MADSSHTLSVLTNLSAPDKALDRFCRLTGPRLRVTSASLHLEHTSVRDFLERADRYRELRAVHNPQSSFVVNSVLVPGRLEAAISAQSQVEAAGFRYFPQLMKIKGGVFPYSPADRVLVETLTRGQLEPTSVNRAPSYHGRLCHAGAWYLVVDQFGDAWRCRTAKAHAPAGSPRPAPGPWQRPPPRPDLDGDDELDTPAWLGHIVSGELRRYAEAAPCPFGRCPCTVPANRGMIAGVGAAQTAQGARHG